MGGKTISLEQGAERLNSVVREVRERQRELSGSDALKPPAINPSEEWSRKFLAEGFGPDIPPGMEPLNGASPQQAQFMNEIKSRAAQASAPAKPVGRAPMAAPAPMRPSPKKRSFLGRLLGG